MRFGLFVPQGWQLDLAGIDVADHWSTMLGVARMADEGPFESIWVYDHLHTVPLGAEEAMHEAWSLMAALGAATSRVRLGQMCTCMGYRNPAYLAKIGATVDVISGGRLEMGVGAGWYEREWRAYGYGFPDPAERFGQLEEGVHVIRELWRTGTATLRGKHYEVDGAIVRPRPLQDGGIPLWIAGGGERQTLRIAAKYADYTNFSGVPEDFRRKSEVLAAHCRDAGTDFDAITRSTKYSVVIGETEQDVRDRLAWIRSHYESRVSGATVDWLIESFEPRLMIGTPEQLVERLIRMRDLGLGYTILYFAEAAYDCSGIELFARDVVPWLQD